VEARVVDRGRLVVETFERPDRHRPLPGAADRHPSDWGAWHVSDTALGNEVLALARDGVPLGLSVGFAEVAGGSRWSPDRRRVTRTRAELDHVAVVRVPAYAGAGVAALCAALQPAATLLTLARLGG
jgi:Caudovirus prohead serine protease